MATRRKKAALSMDGTISIKSVMVSSLLSFGPSYVTLDLEPLNVIVGPNGSGKSNFLELLRVFQATPNDISRPFVRTGGTEQWCYKGAFSNGKDWQNIDTTHISLLAYASDDYLLPEKKRSLIEHKIQLFIRNDRPLVMIEDISLWSKIGKETSYNEEPELENEQYESKKLYSRAVGTPSFIAYSLLANNVTPNYGRTSQRFIDENELKSDQSILSQRKDPEAYPFLSQLGALYQGIYLFTESIFGRSSPARLPQDAALDSTFLFPDASNLALVLNDLQNQPSVMKTIIEKLKLFYERAENIITRVQGGTVQIYFQEEGLTQTVPASRLSDGTLRYLCLLVILCHPSPPPLICIEEPELGMHPDVLPTIAELLIDASQRTQLIVTTHSDLLVSAIGEKHPEAIVVCEKGDNGTTMKRLEADKMKEWLTRYSLGDLWLKGEIGGTRW